MQVHGAVGAYPRDLPVSHPIVQVEPLTTARALRGPFDYVRPDGRRRRLAAGGPVRAPAADRRRHRAGRASPSTRLVAPLRVLPDALPAELVDARRSGWRDEYGSTPARALSLVLPPRGAREKLAAVGAADRRRRGAIAGRAHRRDALRLTAKQLGAAAAAAALRRRRPRRRCGAWRRAGWCAIGAARAPARAAAHAVGARTPRAGAHRPTSGGAGRGAGRDRRAAARAAAAARRHRLGQDRGLPARRRRDAGPRPRRARPRARDRADAADRSTASSTRFGDTVAVLHSKLGAGERYDEWRRLRSGEARVCVGPRSAVFAPIERPRRSSSSTRSTTAPTRTRATRATTRGWSPSAARPARRGARLRQRDAAAGVRPRAAARPAAAARRRRAAAAGRDRRPARPRAGALHPRTHEALVDARKAIVLLNRRGWSNFLTCRSCGRVWECPHCDVALVLHRDAGRASPATTAATASGPGDVPGLRLGLDRPPRRGHRAPRARARGARAGRSCGSTPTSRDAGAVLARLRAAPTRRSSSARRWSPRATTSPTSTLGVVLDADATLRFPDFRAEERTFALVTQLAGRAGRGTATAACSCRRSTRRAARSSTPPRHDSDGFLAEELERRRGAALPAVLDADPDRLRRRRRPAPRTRRATAIQAPASPGSLGPGAAVPPARPRAQPGRRQGRASAARRSTEVGAAVATVSGRQGPPRPSPSRVDVDPQ